MSTASYKAKMRLWAAAQFNFRLLLETATSFPENNLNYFFYSLPLTNSTISNSNHWEVPILLKSNFIKDWTHLWKMSSTYLFGNSLHLCICLKHRFSIFNNYLNSRNSAPLILTKYTFLISSRIWNVHKIVEWLVSERTLKIM